MSGLHGLTPSTQARLENGTDSPSKSKLTWPKVSGQKKALSKDRAAGIKKKPGDDLLSRNSSTIGAEELNFRVRDGNGWDLFAMITRRLKTSLLLTLDRGLGD